MFMVQFTSGEGRPSHHVTESLEEAVGFVERLHNSEGVNDARLFQLTEIPLAVRAYYRVEVGSQPAPMPAVSTLEVEAEPAPVAMTAESERTA